MRKLKETRNKERQIMRLSRDPDGRWFPWFSFWRGRQSMGKEKGSKKKKENSCSLPELADLCMEAKKPMPDVSMARKCG